MGDKESNIKLQNSINKYSELNKDNIDDYIDIGNNIILLIYNEFIEKNTFALYCRNYCNFLINHTDFNYLLEIHSNINSEIIHNFDEYILQIPKLIQINNILLNSIKTNYSSVININLNLYEWKPLKEYAYCVKNILNDDSYIFKFGDPHHMRVWVDIIILQERFDKLENKKNLMYDVALYDLYRFFNWISYRFNILLTNKVRNINYNKNSKFNKFNKFNNKNFDMLKRIEYYNKQIRRNIKQKTKINFILEASGVYQKFLKKEPELRDILPKEDNISKLEINPDIIVPTVITVGTVLISGLIYKSL